MKTKQHIARSFVLCSSINSTKHWQQLLKTLSIHRKTKKSSFRDKILLNFHRDLIFERAYCEYRLNRIEDAHNTLTNVKRDLEEREQELLAQVVN